MIPKTVLALVLAVAAIAPQSAAAAQRFAAPAGATTGTCTAAAPCTLARAIGTAVAGSDVVIVKSGTYNVETALTIDNLAVSGEASGPTRPVLNVAGTVTIDRGAAVSDLEISATGTDAITIKGASVVERVIARSTAGGGKVVADQNAPTILRDSVVIAGGSDGLKLANGQKSGSLALRNVTLAMTNPAGVGLACEVTSPFTASIVNTVVRGSSTDATTFSGCSGTNALLASSPLGGALGNLFAFTDPGLDADLRPAIGAKTIDAGTDVAHRGTYDLDGRDRIAGSSIDAGAYEAGAPPATVPEPAPVPVAADPLPLDLGTTPAALTPTATSGTTATQGTSAPEPAPAAEPAAPQTQPVAPPRLGRSVVLDETRGDVRIKRPGASTFSALDDASNLPVGTVVDATDGAVTLRTAVAGARTQAGTFSGGRFQVRQARRAGGMTDIVLRGGSFARCRARAASAGPLGAIRAYAASRGKSRAAVRRLWGKDKSGRFRTHGRNSVATVRGTRWLTEDRCDGTLTRVTEGAVDVRSKDTGRTRRVRRGGALLVRAAR